MREGYGVTIGEWEWAECNIKGLEVSEAGNLDVSGWGYPSFQLAMTLERNLRMKV